MKRQIFIFYSIFTLILFSGCFQNKNINKILDNPSNPNILTNTIKITSIKLNNNVGLWMVTGRTQELSAEILPENATDKTIIWITSNSSIATVNNGIVTGNKAGITTISAVTVDGLVKGSCIVTVEDYFPVENIQLNFSSLQLNIEDKKQLSVSFTPENASDQIIHWNTSDAAIATVSESGEVSAISPGTTTITAISDDGSKISKCTVKVNDISIILNSTSSNIFVLDTLKISAIISPSAIAAKGVTWSSSNINIATVDSEGFVTSKQTGKVTITAITIEGNKKAVYEISVNNLFNSITLCGSLDTISNWLPTDLSSRMTQTTSSSLVYEYVSPIINTSGTSIATEKVPNANSLIKFATNETWANINFGVANDNVLTDISQEINLIGSNEPYNIYFHIDPGFRYKFTLTLKSRTSATLKIDKIYSIALPTD